MPSALFTTVTAIIMIPVAFFLGIIYLFLLRKFSARFQWRVGPLISMYADLKPLLGRSRILQPLYDILKLFGKDAVVPSGARKTIFRASPYLALACAFIAIFFIPLPGVPLLSYLGDSLVIASYLLIAAVMFTILGAASSGSPWSAIGARRESEIFLIYEIGFVVALFAAAMTYGTLNIWTIATTSSLPLLILNPFAAVLLFLVMIGKLGIKPMDIAEAETEIVGGPYTEYSGKYLAMLQLTKGFLFYDMIGLFIVLFLAPMFGTALWIPVYIISAVVMMLFLSIVHVLHPRWKIDRAMRSYGLLIAVFAILAVIMVALALSYNWIGVVA
jgi:NADH-quinone oxidoreductase subunit H